MELGSSHYAILVELTEISPDVFYYYNESEFHTRAVADLPDGHGDDIASFQSDSSVVKAQARSKHQKKVRFLIPFEPAGTSFTNDFEEKMIELGRDELQQIVWSEFVADNWEVFINWIMNTVEYLGFPMRIVPILLYTVRSYFNAVKNHSNLEIVTVACAALFNLTKEKYNVECLLTWLSALSNKTPSAIRNMEKRIVETLNWDCDLVTPDNYIDMINQEVLDATFSSIERQSKRSLVETLLKKAYSDCLICNLAPSSVAFGCMLTTLAILDPCGVRQCNTSDLLSLAERQALSMDAIQNCVKAFVDFLNEKFAGTSG